MILEKISGSFEALFCRFFCDFFCTFCEFQSSVHQKRKIRNVTFCTLDRLTKQPIHYLLMQNSTQHEITQWAKIRKKCVIQGSLKSTFRFRKGLRSEVKKFEIGRIYSLINCTTHILCTLLLSVLASINCSIQLCNKIKYVHTNNTIA